jgi:hypothetical protein
MESSERTLAEMAREMTAKLDAAPRPEQCPAVGSASIAMSDLLTDCQAVLDLVTAGQKYLAENCSGVIGP